MTTSRRSTRTRARKYVVLGIDPGLARTGYGVVESRGSGLVLTEYGCIETDAKADKHNRLGKIYNEFTDIIKNVKPDVMAVEELFFAKNSKTAFRVGEARGVILLTAEQANIPLKHFTPQFIKQAVTTYGRADKQQVQAMVKLIFNLKEVPKPDDVADGIACAVCAHQTKYL